jgi:D-aspartate ligase
MSSRHEAPLACVIGTMDVVRPLGMAGIRCAVVAGPDDAARWSRHTVAVIPWRDPWREPERLLEALLGFATAQPAPPVLFYEGDWDLLLVSRQRERLARGFRFVVAAPELVEDLVDKERFAGLAARLRLPVPPSRRLDPEAAAMSDLRLPVVVKPLTRQDAEWAPLAGHAKAVVLDDRRAVSELASRLAASGVPALVQEAVTGPDTRIESYHCYVDGSGAVAGEFTGRKLRTWPAANGHTTALTITAAPDVLALGRDLVARLGLRGVAKFDFKRGNDGRLWLLEVNPRFNLWHHAGARAGVNLPALVYGDVTGAPRPRPGAARPGVRWVYHLHDARAARAAGMPLRRWVPWALRSDAISAVALDDPMPLLRGSLGRLRRARRDGSAQA